MKAQVNLEFLAAAIIYLIAVGGVFLNASTFIPDYRQEFDVASKNVEARAVTKTLLTEPGRHSSGSGGTDWEESNAKLEDIEGLGLSSGFMELDREKIENLTTAGYGVNYSQFKTLTGASNQYNFRFVWEPVLDTHREFRKGSAPTGDLDADGFSDVFVEPELRYDSNNSLTPYGRAGNDVHYGNESIDGEFLRMMLTSHDGVYDRLRLSGDDDWNFTDPETVTKRVGQNISTPAMEESFEITSFQNRLKEKGSAVYMYTVLNRFGASPDTSSRVIRMDRYASLEGEPARVEVLAW